MTAFKKTVSLALLCALSSTSVPAETFQEALISVYSSNPQLMAARASVREVDENYIQARAQGRLSATVSGSITPTVSQFNLINVPGTIKADGIPKAGQVQIIQPLYQGGRVKALKRQAKSSILAARESLRNTEQNLFVSSANAYIDVVRDEEAARIRRNNLRVLVRQEQAAKERFDVGVGTRTDIAQAQSRLAQAEAGLAQADAQLEISRAQYTRFIGHSPVNLQPVPTFILPESLPRAINLARENNPQLLAAYFNQQAAGAAIDVAKAASRPVVSLNGTLGATRDQISSFTSADQAAIAAQISIPIFSGGLNKSRIRQARHAQARLEFEARDAELAVNQFVAEIWARRDAAKRSLTASQKQVDAAEVAFEGVELEQQVGTRTTLDVLDAEQEVLNARLAAANAQRNLNAATFELLRALGAFDAESIQLPVDHYDPVKDFERVSQDGMKAIVDKYVPKAIKNTFSANEEPLTVIQKESPRIGDSTEFEE